MTKFGDAIASAQKTAECDHVMSIRTADAAKRVWQCSKCGCRFTTWPGTKHWDWPAEALAERDETIRSLSQKLSEIQHKALFLQHAVQGRFDAVGPLSSDEKNFRRMEIIWLKGETEAFYKQVCEIVSRALPPAQAGE